MRDISLLLLHFFVTVFRLAKPGGVKRAPNLRFSDRLISGLCTLLMRPAAILRAAIVVKPSTLLRSHSALVKRKYRLLFSAKSRSQPCPKGPRKEVIDAIVEMKRRNPIWGCPRIAQQITLAFGIEIDKDVVRRVLAEHYNPSGSGGPLWLTFIGHAKDSLWSVGLFSMRVRCFANLGVEFQEARANGLIHKKWSL